MRIGYARVSSADQNHKLQTDALLAADCDKIFLETASGAQRDRPELSAALDYMRDGDTLIVWKLDRLARPLRQLIYTVVGLQAKGINLISLSDPIDTTMAAGRLIFHVFASLAEFERVQIAERTRAGLASARAQGRLGGRPRALNDDDLAAAKAMLADPQITVAQLAQRLNFAPSTLYRQLPGGRSSIGPA